MVVLLMRLPELMSVQEHDPQPATPPDPPPVEEPTEEPAEAGSENSLRQAESGKQALPADKLLCPVRKIYLPWERRDGINTHLAGLAYTCA
jgi:hypothetical protein